MSLKSCLFFQSSSFQCGDIEFDHAHHGFHCFGVVDEFFDVAWNDLPAEAEAVDEPATGHGSSATLQELVPVGVDLLLAVATDEERDGRGDLLARTAVHQDHLLPFEFDGDDSDLTYGPWAYAFGAHFIYFARVGKDAEIKIGGFFGVVVEPEEWGKFVHGWDGSGRMRPPASRLALRVL